jgi:hypothetical protein
MCIVSSAMQESCIADYISSIETCMRALPGGAADFAGLYIATRADYDISVAPNFWRRMAAEHPNAIEKNYDELAPKHPGAVLGR